MKYLQRCIFLQIDSNSTISYNQFVLLDRQIRTICERGDTVQISITELKANIGKYVVMAETQDIIITKNGKRAAKLTSARIDKVSAVESLFGLLAGENPDLDELRIERILK